MDNKFHPIIELMLRYPQLQLPVTKGISESYLYKEVVRRGRSDMLSSTESSWGFSMSESDSLIEYVFTCGKVEVLHIQNRASFELLIQKLAYHCEPVNVPLTMGASLISGIINWEKIRFHRKLYEQKGESNWNDELKRFTQTKSNYQDTLILLSSGEYSNVSYSKTSFSKEEWLKKSLEIRKYHELTHFIYNKKYPEKKNILLDELLADSMGLIFAIGKYDVKLARIIFGLDTFDKKEKGRLWNYQYDESMETIRKKAEVIIEELEKLLKSISTEQNGLERTLETVCDQLRL